MQSFLDACWQYGDKDKISNLYMSPIVMSTTFGERDGKLNLSVAWEILGGKPCSGLSGYITDNAQLEQSPAYIDIIEKKAESIYRTINQKVASLPASYQAVNQTVSIQTGTDLTPQESEQLSHYVSNDAYVQKTKEDVLELTSLFKGRLNTTSDQREEYILEFQSHFKAQKNINLIYKFNLDGKKYPLLLKIKEEELECNYESVENADVEIHILKEYLEEIVNGRLTFQRAFMEGNMKIKGEFKNVRLLDQLFEFN